MSAFAPINQTDIQLFKPGNKLPHRVDHLWLILNGVVKSYTVSEEGSQITLGFWGIEDLVGTSLSRITPYTLQCIDAVEAIALHRNYWDSFSKNMLYNAQQTQQLSYIVRSDRIAKRLWLLLQWLAIKFGRAIEEGTLIDFKLTHQELADAISTTRITVTKTLIEFEAKGSILRPRTKCIILKRS